MDTGLAVVGSVVVGSVVIGSVAVRFSAGVVCAEQ